MKNLKIGEPFKIAGKTLIFIQRENRLILDTLDQGTKPVRPSLKEVEDFWLSKGYNKEGARKMWDYYESAEPPWTDKLGHPIRSYKQKSVAVWMRDEYKIEQEKPHKTQMVR